jgi:uncharacterized protein YebE (UPF0316 family)
MIHTLFLIFILQVVYVSLVTIRTILTVKGYRYWAALFSTIDIFTYVIGFKIVLDNLNQPINLLVYCVSYGIGILIGIKIEERLALGFIMVQVIIPEKNDSIVKALRDMGYGVTASNGTGLEGPRLILSIITKRKLQNALFDKITSLNPQAFIISYEPRSFRGGYIIGLNNNKVGIKEESRQHV